MMHKGLSVLISVALLLGMLAVAWTDLGNNEGTVSDDTDTDEGLVLWYADDALTEYLTTNALSYQADYGVKITPVLVSGVEYLEQINTASVYDGQMQEDGTVFRAPDLYISTHDNLMRAYLSGLAGEIEDNKDAITSKNFPETALHAITCKGKYVAYPLYYETNYFLYNKTYMKDIATAGMEGVEGSTDVDLQALSTMIPATLDDVLNFANYYDAPETVEAVFKWDVSDIFYNYFFVGHYVDVGGVDGDNNSDFNIYNQQAVECLQVYQNMNNFFSIDAKEVDYDSIIQEFIDGKTVFTVATTDAIRKIEEAKLDGKFDYEYGVTVLPDISAYLKAGGLSVTTCAVVNGYSLHKSEANDFASYLAYDKGNDLYRKAGKIACKRGVSYDNPEIYNISTEYEKSVPLPKMVEASNYWVQLEIAFMNVWNGADPDETLRNLAAVIGAQIDEIDYHIPLQETFGSGAGVQ